VRGAGGRCQSEGSSPRRSAITLVIFMSTMGRSTHTEPLVADLIAAARTWYEMPNGITERALRVAIEALRQPDVGGAASKGKVPADNAPGQTDAPLTPPVEPGSFVIYSDGSALRNPGPAGCGWVVLSSGKVVYQGFESIGHATNQVAEILAAAHGLNNLPANSSIDVHTDSLYVVQTMKGAFKKKANIEHWVFLDEAVRRHASVRFHHVKGHAGHDMNERADVLANKGSELSRKRLAAGS